APLCLSTTRPSLPPSLLFNPTAPTEIYTLSLHDALPISINHQLIPWFGDDLVWHFDDIVPRNQEFVKAVGLDGWNAGLLTKDERSEEHTSELQSRFDLVCRLLLEKKNKRKTRCNKFTQAR